MLTTLPKRSEISRAQWEAWAKMFGKSDQQIRRWVTLGEEKNDHCPLDNLPAFPDGGRGG